MVDALALRAGSSRTAACSASRLVQVTYYEGYLATAKDRRFNWRTAKDPLTGVHLGVKLVSGMGPLLSLAFAIQEGQIEGRQSDWGAWIAPVRSDDVADHLAALGWETACDAGGLDPDRHYFLVGIET